MLQISYLHNSLANILLLKRMETKANSSGSVSEEMLELERKYYEDMRNEAMRQELDLQDEEDAYLARVVFEHMQV